MMMMMMKVSAVVLSLLIATTTVDAKTIVIGGNGGTGWLDGVCYTPVYRAMEGDILEFNFDNMPHDVYKLPNRQAFDDCDFTDALLMAGIGQSPYQYEIKSEDQGDQVIYFACSVEQHCSGGTQKIQIRIEPYLGQMTNDRDPKSETVFGLTPERCAEVQNSTEGAAAGGAGMSMDSNCTEPVLGDDGYYHRSCLSPPATMTPGGVINSLYVLHYPYPRDQRVEVGLRTWEFVYDDPDADDGSVIPSPSNQLYVHHIAGNIILGQGHEGIRRSQPDAPFPTPYGMVTGDDGEFMIFHIIDLRSVDDWLPCIECRCKDTNGTYLGIGGGDGGFLSSDVNINITTSSGGAATTGGINCCHNCTDLVGPTLDYRLRYNVSYAYIEEEKPVKEIRMLTADVSPAVGKIIEFDVPEFQNLIDEHRKETNPTIQRLVREMPFDQLFMSDFFGSTYSKSASRDDTVRLFRCVGHLHVAAIGMYLEEVDTGRMLCNGTGVYGTDPSTDKGFLTAIHVDNYDPPIEFPANAMVRLITEYNASELHTGVMGLYFAFIDGYTEVTAEDTALNVDVCLKPTCDVSLLPIVTREDIQADACVDTLGEHPACTFAGLCDCETFINAPQSSGCGGEFTTDQGSLIVNELCAKSCGCPSSNCVDIIKESQVCTFAGICDCEVFVNAFATGGCGGTFETEFGAVPVNDLCPAYCEVCPETTVEEQMTTMFAERIEEQLESKCRFSTAECREALHNAYTCSMEMTGIEALDQTMRRAVVLHAGHSALKYSKLGAASLHSEDEFEAGSTEHKNSIVPCEGADIGSGNTVGASPEGESSTGGESGAAASFSSIAFTFAALLVAACSPLVISM